MHLNPTLKKALLELEPGGNLRVALKRAVERRIKDESRGGRIGQYLPMDDWRGTLFQPVEGDTVPDAVDFDIAVDELSAEGKINFKRYTRARVKPFLYVEANHPDADPKSVPFTCARYNW